MTVRKALVEQATTSITDSWEMVDVGELFGTPPSPPSVATSHHTLLGYDGEPCLRNGHEAGNGGYSQGKPTRLTGSPLLGATRCGSNFVTVLRDR